MFKSTGWTVFFILFLIGINSVALAQNDVNDSLNYQADKIHVDSTVSSVHSPHKATIYSMILPGLGQAYNKKYWKIPILYAGFGTLVYFIGVNNNEYKLYRDAYYHSLLDDGSPPVNEYETLYASQTLLDYKNYYRRNRDFTYILTAFLYILNVVDAAVDAHLMTWNVDDDLSLNVQPAIIPGINRFKPNGGISLTLKF
jgi:hypothetical protein